MKLKVLALGAAVASISCVTPCSAQLRIEPPTASQPQHRVAYQNSQQEPGVFSPASNSDSASSGDSSYFADGAPSERIGGHESILPEQSSTSASMPPSIAHVPAPAQTTLGVLANTPEVGLVPVCWPDGAGGCRTPNPVADMMMRTWCTEGLWDTYPAQRARICAHIQHRTGGFNRYTHSCSTCDGCLADVGQAAPLAGYAHHGTAASGTEDRMAGVPEVPQGPTAQLVISPVLSAPTQLPSAQVAPTVAQPQSFTPAAPATPVENPGPATPQLDVLPSPLPAGAVPTSVPVVASRSAQFLR